MFELGQAANAGIQRAVDALRPAKALIDPLLRGVSKSNITWADLIQLGGAEAVAITGGPCIPVPIGRADVAQADPAGQLPAASQTATQLVSLFNHNNFTAEVSPNAWCALARFQCMWSIPEWERYMYTRER